MGENRVKRWVKVPACQGPKIKNHTATLVGNKIYVFGGYDGHANHNKTFEFDCDKLTWTPLKIGGEHLKGRNGHTATYADEKIFVVGGWLGAGPLAAPDLFVLDLGLMQWIRPRTSGSSPGACNMHTTDYVKNRDSLLVFRGGDGRRYLNDLHLLNIRTYVWSVPVVSGIKPDPRANHSSALVGDQLYIFGGWDGSKRLNDIHILDTNSLTWSSPVIHGHPPSPRAGMTFTAVGDYIYLFGGSGPEATCFNDLQIFDPKAKTWLVTDNKGGDSQCRNSDTYDNDDNSYNSTFSRTLEPGGQNAVVPQGGNPNARSVGADVYVCGQGPSERAGHTATFVGRRLIVFGGSCADCYLSDMYSLDTDRAPQVSFTVSENAINRVVSMLPEYTNSPEFSDVEFLVEGKVIYGHRMVLSMASQRFNRMFRVGADGECFKEAQETRITIPDVSYVAFLKMMEYLYSGNLNLDNVLPQVKKTTPVQAIQRENSVILDPVTDTNRLENFEIDQPRIDLYCEMLTVADQFMLDHLKQICEKRLAEFICSETVDHLLAETEFSNSTQLRDICLHFKRHAK
uniref:BTB domain-containing protein n=1 Tax=Mucochytrium quahogii TaxID=96639 RepID=A0A7S2W680_9STRA|mmetsp:Transcript_4078/g.6000  ORF Transcript_4078/g.6000 Transcript_4078/m.6000 type:complete len:569 (+) Transcript_4078:87-1793(+)